MGTTSWNEKRCTAADAAKRVRARDTLALPLGPGQPVAFLHALGERADFEDLKVFAALLIDLYPLFTRKGVELLSGFFGPAERILQKAGHSVHFVPAGFRQFATIAERLQPRVMATAATPPDADGWMSLSLHAGATVAELHCCGQDPRRVLIVEMNPKLPRTFGIDAAHAHRLHVDEVDVLVESEREIFELPDPPASAIDHAIAAQAQRFIADGATLQIGIGSIPNEIADLLAEGNGGDYGIHTEMFTNGLMRLHQAGKVSNRRSVYSGVSVATFAAGTRALYDWLDDQQAVRFLPVAMINTPEIISRNPCFVSINGALAIDLWGQVAADTLGDRQYSGIGGHEDFVAGATFSDGGRSLICLPSTAEVHGVRVSRIAAQFLPGTRVTTPRHLVDVVITEYGSAELRDRSERDRAAALIEIAHPDFREELRQAWFRQSR